MAKQVGLSHDAVKDNPLPGKEAATTLEEENDISMTVHQPRNFHVI